MNEKTISELREETIIEIFTKGALPPTKEVVVPNGDDAAAFRLSDGELAVVTTDALVENVHFDLKYTTPRTVGRKLVSVNLSDLAAMGAAPKFLLLNVAFPSSTPLRVVEELAAGIREKSVEFGVYLIGGNVSKTTGPIVVDATLIGGAKQVVKRAGARAGDAVFVVGALGDARAGLVVAQRTAAQKIEDVAQSALLRKLVDPEPLVALGLALSKSGLVHSMCDVSDGLGTDLRRLLKSDRLGAEVFAERVPISESLRKASPSLDIDPLETALSGGEDYALLFSAEPEAEGAIKKMVEEAGRTAHRIGVVVSRPEFKVIFAEGAERALPGGFEHFRGA